MYFFWAGLDNPDSKPSFARLESGEIVVYDLCDRTETLSYSVGRQAVLLGKGVWIHIPPEDKSRIKAAYDATLRIIEETLGHDSSDLAYEEYRIQRRELGE
jgi:hypothetical protein